MNGFLVLVRCEEDTYPVRLCDSAAEAQNHANQLTHEDVECAAWRVLGQGPTAPLCVVIVPFINGEPQEHVDCERLFPRDEDAQWDAGEEGVRDAT